MTQRRLLKVWAILATSLMALLVTTLPSTATVPAPWTADFSGTPSAPQDFCSVEFDCAVHVREPAVLPPAMQMSTAPSSNCIAPVGQTRNCEAQHGVDCSAYPNTHSAYMPNTGAYSNGIFLCNNHVMTAIFSPSYGEVALTPAHMVDISGGTASVNFSVSSFRTSARDWWDIFFTPFSENVVMPVDLTVNNVDLQGPPADGFHVRVTNGPANSLVLSEEFNNFAATTIPGNHVTSIQSLVCPASPPVTNCLYGSTTNGSASNRTPMQIDFSGTHFKLSIPACAPGTLGCLPSGNAYVFSDVNFPTALNATQYVVQFTHHSYNPQKDCTANSSCIPDTWHWGAPSISAAVPFTVDKAAPDAVGPYASLNTVTVNLVATPANGFLRFTAVGVIQVSFDGGATFQPATQQRQRDNSPNNFTSYWMATPTGTTSIVIKGDHPAPPYNGTNWMLRDITVWAQ